jgi:hypothetical protein
MAVGTTGNCAKPVDIMARPSNTGKTARIRLREFIPPENKHRQLIGKVFITVSMLLKNLFSFRIFVRPGGIE